MGNDTAEAGLAAVIFGARETPYLAVMPVCHPWQKAVIAMWRGSNAIPSWSWRGCEGVNTQVEVYSRGAEVELYLNGVSCAREKLCGFKAVFHPDYAPGELRAVSFDENGKRLGESVLRSADGALRLRVVLEPKRTDDNIYYIAIDIVGENGEIESHADRELSVKVEGAELLGFGSADPVTEESYLTGVFKSFYGRAQAVVRKRGDAIVRVTADGLESVELRF